MFKREKHIKSLDRNELIIKWGDEIVLNANHLGEISKESFMLDWVFSDLPPSSEEISRVQNDPARKIRDEVLKRLGNINGELDIIGKTLEEYVVGVKNHLLSHNYIKDPITTERFWRLSDKGESMKELGGHKKYQAYKKREFAATISDQNSKKYYLPILIAIVGILVSGSISWLAYYNNKTKTEKAEGRLDKLDARQDSTTLRVQTLQSQLDSISNQLLSNKKDTLPK